MPVISVTLIEGYPDAVRTRLCERLTDAAMAVIAAPAEGVTVFVNEVRATSYMRGRGARTPGPAPVPPAECALDLLDAQRVRDTDRFEALTAEGFEMVFPGGARFGGLAALSAWAATRYRRIAKHIERIEEAPMGTHVAVYVSGTLEGEWTDGAPFSGIRFIDRFEVEHGRVIRQEVWNDLDAARIG